MTAPEAFLSLFHCHYCEGARHVSDDDMPWYQDPTHCCPNRELILLYPPIVLPDIMACLITPTLSGLTSSLAGRVDGYFHWDSKSRCGIWEVELPSALAEEVPSCLYGSASSDNERGIVANHRTRYNTLRTLTTPVPLLTSRYRRLYPFGYHEILTSDQKVIAHLSVKLLQRTAKLTDTSGNLLALFINARYGEDKEAPRVLKIYIPRRGQPPAPNLPSLVGASKDVSALARDYQNQQPVWHDGINSYVLYFDRRRITERSVKNFVFRQERRTLLQFGRVLNDRSTFVLDADSPFSPLLAYATALVACTRTV